MIEKCKMCGFENTPWTYIKELDGHICHPCSFLHSFLTDNFNTILEYIKKSEDIANGVQLEYNKKSIKKGMLAVIRRWYKDANKL